jgi:hypothetical protein|nr:hypothetical protein [Kofleriaceae bacterium]
MLSERGAAPSLICPRCRTEAPPAMGVTAMVTCTACGLVFSATPHDAQMPARLVAAPAGMRDRPEPPRRPSARAIALASFVAVFGLAAAIVLTVVIRDRAHVDGDAIRREAADQRTRDDQFADEVARAVARGEPESAAYIDAALATMTSRDSVACQHFSALLDASTCTAADAHDKLDTVARLSLSFVKRTGNDWDQLCSTIASTLADVRADASCR